MPNTASLFEKAVGLPTLGSLLIIFNFVVFVSSTITPKYFFTFSLDKAKSDEAVFYPMATYISHVSS